MDGVRLRGQGPAERALSIIGGGAAKRAALTDTHATRRTKGRDRRKPAPAAAIAAEAASAAAAAVAEEEG